MKVNINGYIIPNNYKQVYDWFGMESCCPNDIKIAKDQAPGEPLDITIGTCYGGDIFAGSEIGSEIAACEKGSTGKIMGLAASAASVLAMYINHLSMAPTAMLMAHNVSSHVEGDYHVMGTEKSTLINCNKAMAAAYSHKSGMSENEALKMMDNETWLTAQQAKEKGLIDEVMFEGNPEGFVNAVGPGMIPKAVVDKTLKMLNEKKDTKQIDLAKAKLNLIEKTII